MKNPIHTLRTLKFQVVHMFKFKTIMPKLFHFIRDQIKLMLIKWHQVLKLNLWLGFNL